MFVWGQCVIEATEQVFFSNVPASIHNMAFPEKFLMSDFLSGIITGEFLEVLFQFTCKSFQGKLDEPLESLRV